MFRHDRQDAEAIRLDAFKHIDGTFELAVSTLDLNLPYGRRTHVDFVRFVRDQPDVLATQTRRIEIPLEDDVRVEQKSHENASANPSGISSKSSAIQIFPLSESGRRFGASTR
jgi:hypothetical protein